MSTFLTILGVLGGLLVIAVVVAAIAESKAKDRREAYEAHKRASDEEERKKEEARLAPKRSQFASVRAEAKTETQFLDPAYRKTYAYQHYDQVMQEEKGKLRVYQMWLDDPDFKANKLTENEHERRTIEGVFEAKKDLVAFAGGLTRADRTNWEGRQIVDMKEAGAAGLTLDQLKERRVAEPELLASIHKRFEQAVHASVTIDLDELGKKIGKEGAAAGNAQAALDPQAVIADMTSSPTKAVTSLAIGFHSWYAARVSGEGIPMMDLIERLLLKYLRETSVGPDKNFKTTLDLAQFCFECQSSCHKAVVAMMDERIKAFSDLGTWTDLKILPPYEKWASEYRSRVPAPRTPAQFDALINSL